jgi:RNA polymerase sigma-70 factor (ECF subfamily)
MSDPGATLSAAVGDIVARARARWPHIAIDVERFADWIGARAGAVEDPVRALAALHGVDLYLARACSLGVPAALEAFEREVLVHVPDFIARVDGAAALVDEVKQRLRTRLFVGDGVRARRIDDYSGRGALGAWIRVAAVRTAIDVLREGGRERPRDDAADLARAQAPSADVELLRARYQGAYEAAIRAALQELDRKQRNLLRLHFVDGMSVDGIGTAYGVHRATAARWLAQARSDLCARTERILGAELGLSRDELLSLAAVVRSQLHVSVARLLG